MASKRSASTNKFLVSGVTLDATEVANDKTASQQGSAKRENMASQTQGDGKQEKRTENIRKLARGVVLRMWRDPTVYKEEILNLSVYLTTAVRRPAIGSPQ